LALRVDAVGELAAAVEADLPRDEDHARAAGNLGGKAVLAGKGDALGIVILDGHWPFPHLLTVVLSAAKDLIAACRGHEILRYAHEDKNPFGTHDVKRQANTCCRGRPGGLGSRLADRLVRRARGAARDA